jgi:hypothetical protein
MQFVSQTATTIQNGALGTPVSFTVQVMDSNRVTPHPLAAPGIVVNAIPGDFNLVTGSVTTATTDGSGKATIGPIRVNVPAGTISFTLAAPNLPVAAASQPTTVIPGPATTIASSYPNIAAEPLPATSGATSSQLFFRVTDGYNAPSSPVTVNLSVVAGSCSLSASSTSIPSDASGEVHPAVVLPGSVGGCVLRASVPSLPAATPAESQLALYATGTTHVWSGAVSDKWDDPSNWYSVATTGSGTIPSAASQALVPTWPAPYAPPRLTTLTQIDKLWVQDGGFLDQSGQTLIIGNGGVVAPAGSLTNGTTNMRGTGTLDGTFDRLAIGQVDGVCSGVNASLGLVTSKTLDVYCATRVDSSARAQTLTVYAAGGTLTLPSSTSSLAVSGNADFSGDLLQVDNGNLQVDGAATLGGGRVVVTGGQIAIRGAAVFKSASASFDAASVLVQGDATFAGTGSQKFNTGKLTLQGNMAQIDSGVANFDASADHVTIFEGAKPQAISFADPSSSHFGELQIANSAGVTFATSSNQPASSPTARSITLQPNGVMSVRSGAAVSLAGGISLLTGSTLIVDGSLSVLSCANTGARIGGTGLINDLLSTLFVCR